MVPESSEVVMEVVLVGMTTLAMEEVSAAEVALVAAVVVVDMVACGGMAIMDLVMMEATNDGGGRSYDDFGNYNNQSSNFGPIERKKC